MHQVTFLSYVYTYAIFILDVDIKFFAIEVKKGCHGELMAFCSCNV